MDQQQRRDRTERRLLDLDDAPGLDPSEESALEAIRRQLDEEFARAEAGTEVTDAPDARGAPDARPDAAGWVRPRAERHGLAEPETRPRPAAEGPRRMRGMSGLHEWSRITPDDKAQPGRGLRERRAPVTPDDEAPGRGLRERRAPTWARPERFRDERPAPTASRGGREPVDRFPVQRLPPNWREVESVPPDAPGSRRGLLVSIGLAAGLAGGAAGALLTVLLVTGAPLGDVQQSWAKLVGVVRDSGLVDLAARVTDRAPSTAARNAEPRGTADRPTPPPAPRRGPVTTAEIPGPVESGTQQPESAASLELRGLVSAGREAYVRRDYAMAERLFAQAVERSSGDGLLRYHHAIALMGLGRFSEARVQFQNALRLGVDSIVADEAQRALAQISTSRRRR